MPKKADSIAGWIRTSKGGKEYMSVLVEVDGVKRDYVMFPSDKKGKDGVVNPKRPDWVGFKSEPRQGNADESVPF